MVGSPFALGYGRVFDMLALAHRDLKKRSTDRTLCVQSMQSMPKRRLPLELPKKQKRPVHEPDDSGTHTRADILLEGGGFTLKSFLPFEYSLI
jgi:hypothetical protein